MTSSIERKWRDTRNRLVNPSAGTADLISAMRVVVHSSVTLQELSKSGVGRAVERLAAHADTSVARISRYILATWRATLVEGIKVPKTIRDRARDMLETAFEFEPDPPMDEQFEWTPNMAAREVEARLYELRGDTKQYRQHVRTIYANLLNDDSTVRRDLLSAPASPARVCAMSIDAMASPKLKRERDTATANSLLAATALKPVVTEGEFVCGRCHSHKTTHHEQQTRSADESMTVFICCADCGKRWKQ
jgi:DNA-directed RNA polymerase subunit M/transcription elongation factor TFIIS